jgi:hypothetical protein
VHKSRLSTLVIDGQTDPLDGAADFWSHARGRPSRAPDDPAYANYQPTSYDLSAAVVAAGN